MAQVPLVSQYDPYNHSAQQLQQLQQQQPQPQPQPQVQHSQQMNHEPGVMRNLMVNYIPTTVDEAQLRQLFERFGPIESVKIVCDRENRQSRGYGFVKFQNSASAQQAITELNGYTILNKRLKVALAATGHQRGGAVAAQVSDGNGYFGGYGGYGAYPPGANPYAQQQQMMAMYQHYVMQPQHQQAAQLQQAPHPQQQQQPQQQPPPPPQQQQPLQGGNRPPRK